MTVENGRLLQSQEALQTLSQASLRGTYALRLKDILEPVEKRLRRLQEVRQNLMEREDMDDETAEEEWQMVLQDELEIDEEPLPIDAVETETVEISAGALIALDWLFE